MHIGRGAMKRWNVGLQIKKKPRCVIVDDIFKARKVRQQILSRNRCMCVLFGVGLLGPLDSVIRHSRWWWSGWIEWGMDSNQVEGQFRGFLSIIITVVDAVWECIFACLIKPCFKKVTRLIKLTCETSKQALTGIASARCWKWIASGSHSCKWTFCSDGLLNSAQCTTATAYEYMSWIWMSGW